MRFGEGVLYDSVLRENLRDVNETPGGGGSSAGISPRTCRRSAKGRDCDMGELAPLYPGLNSSNRRHRSPLLKRAR